MQIDIMSLKLSARDLQVSFRDISACLPIRWEQIYLQLRDTYYWSGARTASSDDSGRDGTWLSTHYSYRRDYYLGSVHIYVKKCITPLSFNGNHNSLKKIDKSEALASWRLRADMDRSHEEWKSISAPAVNRSYLDVIDLFKCYLSRARRGNSANVLWF